MTRNLDRAIDGLNETLNKLLGTRRKRTILSGQEVRMWLEHEPTFPKSITKHLSDDTYHPKRSDGDSTEPEGNAFMKQGLPRRRSRFKTTKIGQRLFRREIPKDREAKADRTILLNQVGLGYRW